MAMAFMVRPALFRSSGMLLYCLLTACNPGQDTLTAYPAATTELQWVNGQAFLQGEPFRGQLYSLGPTAKDTLYCNDYRDGLPDGRQQSWYPNGQTAVIRFYRQGRKEGRHLAFWPDGSRRFCYTYTADCYEGAQYEWYAGGQAYSIRHYHKGQEDGLQQVWSKDGKYISNYEAKNGRNYGNIGTQHCTPVAPER